MTVVCLGDVMTDVVARLGGRLATGSDTPSDVVVRGGGSAANTACWLAELGVPALFTGRVGNDALGREALAAQARAGVKRAVATDQHRSTGTCIVLVDPDGERTMIPDSGANAALRVDDLPPLDGAAWLHVSGYSLFAEGARSAALAALERATSAGVPTSVDAASAAPLQAFGARRFLALFGTNVLLFANRDESEVLVPGASPLRAAAALSNRVGRVVVKCGADGAVWAQHGEPVEVRAPRRRVIDSTGAGDAFAAGLIAALLDGAPAVDAVARAHVTAARALCRPGGRP